MPGFPAARNIKFARGALGGTGPFSSGGCWNCNYREAVSGGKLTWISTHVPCVFHLQTCGLYSTFSFNRKWAKRGWKRLWAQYYERPGPSLPSGAERERICHGTTPRRNMYYIQIHSSTEEEICKVIECIEWSMRNRLTTEAAVNTMLGDTPPTPALPLLKGNEEVRPGRFEQI